MFSLVINRKGNEKERRKKTFKRFPVKLNNEKKMKNIIIITNFFSSKNNQAALMFLH